MAQNKSISLIPTCFLELTHNSIISCGHARLEAPYALTWVFRDVCDARPFAGADSSLLRQTTKPRHRKQGQTGPDAWDPGDSALDIQDHRDPKACRDISISQGPDLLQ